MYRFAESIPEGDFISTILDVARIAGVSRTTVSRYLNGYLDRNSKTARKIRQVIEELNYRPNLLARSLRSTISRSVAVIVPDLRNPFYPELLSGVEMSLAQHGIQVFVGQSTNDALREPEMLQNYSARQVDGIVYVSATSEPSAVLRDIAESIPTIILDEEVSGFEESTVRVDHEMGLYKATKYLLDMGHRRLAYIAGPPQLKTTELRIKGMQLALSELPNTAEVEVVHGTYQISTGGMWAEHLMHDPHPPTAILCANDLVALGVHRKLYEMGISVPSTISIIGFDDIFLSKMVSPTLTTLRQPLEQLGRAVTENLIEVIRSGSSHGTRTILAPELVVRESTAPAIMR